MLSSLSLLSLGFLLLTIKRLRGYFCDFKLLLITHIRSQPYGWIQIRFQVVFGGYCWFFSEIIVCGQEPRVTSAPVTSTLYDILSINTYCITG